jgi:ectoine hydroxylase
MQLTQSQLDFYSRNGFLLLQECFSQAEIRRLSAELPSLEGEDSQRRVVEKDGGSVRSIYGSHTSNNVFQQLTRHPRLVEPARQILNSDVYL